jgi:hypothetical protein
MDSANRGGRRGAAYVTNKTLAPTGTGEVLRIPLD